MRLFLQLTFRQLYHFVRNKGQRQFTYLALRWGTRARFRPFSTRVAGVPWQAPDGPSFVWQYKEIFADNSYLFHTDTPRPVVLDCGANVGLASLYIKRKHPQAQVWAYEADPVVFSYLQKNVLRAELNDVHCINRVVWTHTDGVEFASEGADGGSIYAQGTRTRLPSADLRQEMEHFERIDLLKMDIEGAETQVLLHIEDQLPKVQHLFVEYHAFVGQAQELSQILALLERQGFRYFIRTEADRLQPFVHRTNRSNPQMDMQLNIFAYK